MPTNNATRAKNLLGLAKPKSPSDPDGDPKGTNYTKKTTEAVVWEYPSAWATMLANETPTALQINPDNPTDPLDIGEWDGVTFTPSDDATISKARNKHFLQVIRRWLKAMRQAHKRKDPPPLVAGDVGGGATADDAKAAALAAEAAEDNSELGEDSTDDPI